MDNGFNRDPGKNRVPLGQKHGIPKACNTPVTVGKMMDALQLIVKHSCVSV